MVCYTHLESVPSALLDAVPLVLSEAVPLVLSEAVPLVLSEAVPLVLSDAYPQGIRLTVFLSEARTDPLEIFPVHHKDSSSAVAQQAMYFAYIVHCKDLT